VKPFHPGAIARDLHARLNEFFGRPGQDEMNRAAARKHRLQE
jgi:hypothetical protein